MWSNKLASIESSPEVVYLNAWESDFQGDPLLAIVSALLDRLEPKRADKNIESIKETAGKLCRFGLSIGRATWSRSHSIDFVKAGEYAEPKEDVTEQEVGHKCFQLYREKQELFARLKSLLTDLAGESENRIFVFVDELDRCRPNYAIDFLETIKHFFDIDGLVFVLGIDKKQLASSARSLFGQQLDFDEYYRKFAHRNVTLPVKSAAMAERFSMALVPEYFSEEAYAKKNRFPDIRQDQYATKSVVESTAFSLNGRRYMNSSELYPRPFGHQQNGFALVVGLAHRGIIHGCTFAQERRALPRHGTKRNIIAGVQQPPEKASPVGGRRPPWFLGAALLSGGIWRRACREAGVRIQNAWCLGPI